MATEQTGVIEQYEQLVVFELADEAYGVDISAVNTIIRMQEITSIPRTSDFIEGVINLRGSIIPVIDLRKRFGLPAGETTKSSRIVVVEAAKQMIGMMVDAVAETLKISNDAIEQPSSVVVSVDSQYIRGIGKEGERLLILLDMDKVLSVNECSTLENLKQKELKEAA